MLKTKTYSHELKALLIPFLKESTDCDDQAIPEGWGTVTKGTMCSICVYSGAREKTFTRGP